MLKFDLEFLLGKTLVRLNLKIDLVSLYISPGFESQNMHFHRFLPFCLIIIRAKPVSRTCGTGSVIWLYNKGEVS